MRAVIVQVFSRAANVVLPAFLRLNDLAWCFDNVNFTNVLDESLDVRQWWLISLCANAITPQAVINDGLALSIQGREVFLNAADTFRDCVFQSITWIFKLMVALVPTALENLRITNFRLTFGSRYS